MPTVDLSDGTSEALDIGSVEYAPGGRLYCSVKDGEFRARFKRGPYYQLASEFEERGQEVWLELGAESVKIGELDGSEET